MHKYVTLSSYIRTSSYTLCFRSLNYTSFFSIFITFQMEVGLSGVLGLHSALEQIRQEHVHVCNFQSTSHRTRMLPSNTINRTVM